MKNLNLTLILLLLAVISFAQNVPSYVPTNGLVGWWPFNGNANDESGNGNNGTVNGATLTSDRFGNTGKSYSFDGNDWIDVNSSSSLNFDSTITISVWINSDQSNFNSGLIGKWNDFNGLVQNGQEQFGITINDANSNSIYSLLKTDLSQVTYVQNQNCSYSDSIWHNVIYIWDDNSLNLYFDGLLIGSTNISGRMLNFLQNLEIGRYGGGQATAGGNVHYKGVIDDIGIWNRALDSTEIAALYNSSTSTATIQNNLSNDIKIFPNPTYNHITIDAGNLNTMSGYSIRIVNALGQQVFQSAINQQQFYLDLSSWTGNGIYYVNIINPQGVTIDTRKIVLQ